MIVMFLSNGGKSAKHDSPIRAICTVKPWNPWPRSFSTTWDAIAELVHLHFDSDPNLFRRAASCSERKCNAELVHLHFDSDPNLPVSREKYDLSMESKDPRSK